MTQEEKAKAYDEALERAKKYKLKEDLIITQDIFPELHKSEDEKIRKELISFFKNYSENGTWKAIPDVTKWIAWLEKQDWQKPYGQREECSDCEFRCGDKCIGSCAMKRDEQKPVDVKPIFKVGDKVKHGYLTFTVENIDDDSYEMIAYGEDGHKGTTVFLTIGYEDDYELIEQKPVEWSEEDERMKTFCINAINGITYYSPENKEELIDWLKSLRPQNNITDEELAQAKKNAFNEALDKIEYHSGEPTFEDGWCAALKFVKQKQWKPTEEQMKALLWVRQNIPYNIHKEYLSELYEQLKKL